MTTAPPTTRTLFDRDDAAGEITRTPEAALQPGQFQMAMRQLMQARLRGEINFEDFAKANLELHFRFGRKGYDRDQYERDIAEHRRRLARTRDTRDQRPIRWVTEVLADAKAAPADQPIGA